MNLDQRIKGGMIKMTENDQRGKAREERRPGAIKHHVAEGEESARLPRKTGVGKVGAVGADVRG